MKDTDMLDDSMRCFLGGVHVVVVDDSDDEREMLAFVFARYGAKVTALASANEALSAVRAAKPDVLVSDIELEDGNGYTLVRELRTLPPAEGGDTPAVALTGWGSESDREAAIDAGFHVHMVKPVPVEALVTVVAALSGVRTSSAPAGTNGERTSIAGSRHTGEGMYASASSSQEPRG
jgi:CheY-like chemotaxis protein